MNRVLIADDDPAICDALSMILQAHDYRVIVETEGQNLLRLADELPDLILLDVWMSGMDGRDIAKQLKGRPLTKHIPIIMVSASRELAESAKNAGADDFLEKPFMMQDLLSKIEKHL